MVSLFSRPFESPVFLLEVCLEVYLDYNFRVLKPVGDSAFSKPCCPNQCLASRQLHPCWPHSRQVSGSASQRFLILDSPGGLGLLPATRHVWFERTCEPRLHVCLELWRSLFFRSCL